MAKKTKYLLGIAGSMLATGALYASSVTNTFETGTAADNGWTGDGTVGVSNFTYTAAAGLPASTALPNGNHVLLVEGTATCSPTLGSGNTPLNTPLMDMMVQTARPDDVLEAPDSGDAQIAVAVDSNGCFNVYCTDKSGGQGWCQLSATEYADSAWARVSLLFDYTAKRCQVRIDGEPMMTANGYLTASSNDTTKNGAWYRFANESATSVASMKVIGCTAIDEVVMNETSDSYAIADATTDSGISRKWLDAYGLAWDAATAAAKYGNSGMTVAQKYNACLSPFDDQTFAVKSVKATANNITVGIPKTIATPGRKVVLEYGATTSMGNEIPVAAGLEEVSVDPPEAGAVKYFRLKATVDQQQ